MSRLDCKKLYVQFDGRVLTAAGKSFDVTHEGKSVDATTFADDYEVTAATTKSLKVSMKVIGRTNDEGFDAFEAALQPHIEGDLIWGREGNSMGKPKRGAHMRVSKFSESYSVGNMAEFDVEFEMAAGSLLFGPGDMWT